MGLKTQILTADDRPYEDMEVEEWGETVRLRGLSGRGAEQFSRSMQSDGEEVPPDIMAALLVRTLEDPETGEMIFEPEDAEALSGKSSHVLTRLFQRAQKLSGLGELEAAKND